MTIDTDVVYIHSSDGQTKLLNDPGYGSEYHLLTNKDDYYWHKKSLDLSVKHELNHVSDGEPREYPCFVKSEYQSEDYRADWWSHTFIYRQVEKCPNCGHETKFWPKIEE